MKTFVVLETYWYGQYVHLVKAESSEEAKKIISEKYEYSSIRPLTDGVSPLDDLLSLLKDNDSIYIGGYAE